MCIDLSGEQKEGKKGVRDRGKEKKPHPVVDPTHTALSSAGDFFVFCFSVVVACSCGTISSFFPSIPDYWIILVFFLGGGQDVLLAKY